MKHKLLLAFCLFITTLSIGQTEAHKDSLNAIIKTYYDLNIKVFQSDSKPADVDEIFKIFTDDFTYIHPKYGGVYTRDVLLKGYLRNQKNGRYDGDVTSIKIVNKIVGLNSVVVARKYVTKKDGVGDSKMTLFEFKNGKISKIFEYW